MGLQLYNSLNRQKEEFQPREGNRVGIYVCGPTVYGHAHLGHAKSYVSFDVLVRYLRYLGYHVTYVQNITDVGHLTDDADEGEDKLAVAAAKEKRLVVILLEFFHGTSGVAAFRAILPVARLLSSFDSFTRCASPPDRVVAG